MGAKLAIVAKDRTAAERQRRHRQRRRAQGLAVTVTHPVTVSPVTTSHRYGSVSLPLLCAALAIAAVSGSFSIVGLTAVFTGAVWPVTGMGVALEAAKLTAVAWLGRRYSASRWLRGAVVTLVLMLMALNIVGAYGFLSKAHIDHAVAVEADIADHKARVVARREVAMATVADLDRRIAQIDSAVDAATRRGRTASAMALAEHQTGRRNELVADRERAANTLASIEVENARTENELGELAAESGPIRYLSMLIGIDQDTATRWFVLVVAVLLDPLALVLLLAASVARDHRSEHA
jgi:hypothetical protein